MRFLLLLSALIVADAIRPGYQVPDGLQALVWFLLIFTAGVDLIDLSRCYRDEDRRR